MIGLGHRRTGFINGSSRFPHFQQQLLGFRGTILLHDLSLASCPVTSGFSREGAYAAAASLLDGAARLTAVFAASEPIAAGAMQCLHDRGLRVPEDMSISTTGCMHTCLDPKAPGCSHMHGLAAQTVLGRVASGAGVPCPVDTAGRPRLN